MEGGKLAAASRNVKLSQIDRLRSEVATAYYVSVEVAGVAREALVDTGATVTMATASILEAAPALKALLRPASVSHVTGISGRRVPLVGELCLPIVVRGFESEPHRIVVFDDVSETFPCILGLDFLDSYGLLINTVGRCLMGRSEAGQVVEIPLRAVWAGESVCRVTCRERVVVPPRTCQFLQVNIGGVATGTEGCIEPVVSKGSALLLARSLNKIEDGGTFVEVSNWTDKPIRLEKDQKVGVFEVMQDGICALDSVPRDAPTEESVVGLFDLDATDLTEKQKLKVREFLAHHGAIIGRDELDLGCTGTVEHVIDVEGAAPIKQRYRRFPAPLRKEVRAETDKLLRQGIIEPSVSAWSSPLVPVRKKNGKLRLCIDYRAVNAKTKKDSFPLPNLNDAVSQFREGVYFSSLDLLAGYHQIKLSPESREITAFSTGDDLYQYTRLPFGVVNGPSSFSRLVSIVLAGLPWDRAQAYLDDILVAGASFDDHLENLGTVFSRLAMHGLKLNAEKCELFRSEVNYLGHVVGRSGVRPLRSNVEAIVNFPAPTTVRQLRSFNGMVNFYKKFIQYSAHIMQPLYAATSGRTLKWTTECQKSFDAAKSALTTAPVLAYPSFHDEHPFIVTTDASAFSAGAVLSQVQEGLERVIGFAGTSFNPAQRRYSPTDRELAAIRFGVTHFKSYLYGRHFVIRTDHAPLVYLNQMKRCDDRLHRTLEDLSVGHYEIEYLPGRSNIVADTLSRVEYPWMLPEETEYPVCLELGEVPSFDRLTVVKLEGGPESLFQALSLSLYATDTKSVEIRDNVVDVLLKSPTRYGYQSCAGDRNKIEVLRDAESFPPFVVLQAFADGYGQEVVVYSPICPVVRVKPLGALSGVVLVQCLGGVHFNHVKSREQQLPRGALEAVGVATAGPGSEGLLPDLVMNDPVELVRAHQEGDAAVQRLVALVRLGTPVVGVSLCDELAAFRPVAAALCLNDDGVLCVRRVFQDWSGMVAVVPRGQLVSICVAMHELLNHAGRDKVVQVVKTKYFHPAMSAVVAECVRNCAVCQCYKGHPVGDFPLYRRTAERPYEVYSVDLMDLPKSRSGYNCVLVGVDRFSKFGHVVPLRNKTSRTVARALEAHILSTVPRTPETILSDSGPEFRGGPFRELLKTYGIAHDHSVPYAPHTNGQVERLNQTIKNQLAVVCHGDMTGWDRKVYGVVAQYNRVPHSETGRAPVEFFGVGRAEINVPKPRPFWRPAGRRFRSFEPGALVMRRIPFYKPGEHSKLSPKFEGPYRVMCCDPNGVTLKLSRVSDGKLILKVHVSQVKAFHGQVEMGTSSPRDAPVPAGGPGRLPGVKMSPEEGRLGMGIDWDKLIFVPSCAPGEVLEGLRDTAPLRASVPSVSDSVPQEVGSERGRSESLENFMHWLSDLPTSSSRLSLAEGQSSGDGRDEPPLGEGSGPTLDLSPGEAPRVLPRRSTRMRKLTSYFGFNS